MGNVYFSYFNLTNYGKAEKVFIKDDYYFIKILNEYSEDNSNNIYLTNDDGFNYYLATERKENFYLGADASKIARGLTKLTKTDLLKPSKLNYYFVQNFHTSFANCFSLDMEPISSENMKTMYGSYYNCTNLYGSPQVDLKVNNLIATYYNCTKLSGQPVCPDNVISMKGAYYNCVNITGSPQIGAKTRSAEDAYYNCYSLQGAPADCNNLLIAVNTYYNCPNLYGTFNWYEVNSTQAKIINATNMFYHRDYSRRLNIYVKADSSVENALINYSATYGNLYGTGAISWTQSGGYYYNSLYNTYIYSS